MMNNMIVRYLGGVHGACDLYRAAFPFKHVESDTGFVGKDVTTAYDTKTQEFVGTNIEADVLIIPRPSAKVQYEVALAAKAQGIAVVVDIDDMLDDVHKDNDAYTFTSKGIKWFYKTMEIADLITCSTNALADKYHPTKSLIINNYMPDFVFDHDASTDKVGIGWTGSLGVHPDDLQVTGDAIKRMVKKHGAVFKHVGRGNISPIIKTEYTRYGKLDYDQYLLCVDTFEVGIVPLEASEFNNAKSWLKGLEYASMGVPFVASTTAKEYERMKAYFGLGVLANSPYEWYTELRRLYTDKTRLAELSAQYRETSEKHLRMSKNAWKWDEAWETALRRSKDGV